MTMESVLAECSKCFGTGLYQGMGEREGVAVVCHQCLGTGSFTIEWEPFTGRKPMPGIERVFETNPGVTLGNSPGYLLEDLGGLSYAEWQINPTFPRGSEVRAVACPAQWAQSTWKAKPGWSECVGIGQDFKECSRFRLRAVCWARWDREKGAQP